MTGAVAASLMATVIFYGKPNCATNIRQRRLLELAGHQVIARDLLSEPWTPERLRDFFAGLPVAEWFNRAAPAVKSGLVNPDALEPEAALALMLATPLLIRRPLLQVGARLFAGFNPPQLQSCLDFGDAPAITGDPESCSHPTRSGSAPGTPWPMPHRPRA